MLVAAHGGHLIVDDYLAVLGCMRNPMQARSVR